MSESIIKRPVTRMGQLEWFGNREIPLASNLNNIIGDFVISRWDSSTLNTPQKQGITGSGDGICISDVYDTYGIQVVFAQSSGIFIRGKSRTWGSWKTVGTV